MSWYDSHAVEVSARYEALNPDRLYEWVRDLLPKAPSLILDIGAGSGRDAAWFAKNGHEVVAVEPSNGMREQALQRHRASTIRWLVDSLPSLSRTLRLGLAADVILVNAVWQHVAPGERERAFRKIIGLLRSGGLLIISLRLGPDDGRGAYQVSADEIERLARDFGLEVVRRADAPDALGRSEVRWTSFALRLPDDGTGALALLRHIILNDTKSATYKLGLLRAICRAADGSAGLAVDDGDDHVRLPLGLIALNWMRLYLPLTKADLPQLPRNRSGAERLNFAGTEWNVVSCEISQRDLRVGANFSGDTAKALHAALRKVGQVIRLMPATHLTYGNGGRIFEVESATARFSQGTLAIDGQSLAAFGTIRVPLNIWRAMQRFAVWIEPALVAEWARQIQGYAESQGRKIGLEKIASAMIWSDPERATALSRKIAQTKINAGEAIYCVWSGRHLTRDNLDIDHCFPWSAWPCNDLWNLLPATRTINQREKRERLPSAEALSSSEDRVISWWNTAYLKPEDSVLPHRFGEEARASLPHLAIFEALNPTDVFEALQLQRLRLRQDQGVPEWTFRK